MLAKVDFAVHVLDARRVGIPSVGLPAPDQLIIFQTGTEKTQLTRITPSRRPTQSEA